MRRYSRLIFCMEQYIPISTINDFLYSPRSLYLHSIYQSFTTKTYHSHYQVRGNLNHEKIEKGEYSSRKRFIQALEVYSEIFGVMGKIDVFDTETCTLIERKTKMKKIFPGHRYQLYAQMFGMIESGFEVKALKIHSLEDNVRYNIAIPTVAEVEEFSRTLEEMRNYDWSQVDSEISKVKTEQSIYKDLSF